MANSSIKKESNRITSINSTTKMQKKKMFHTYFDKDNRIMSQGILKVCDILGQPTYLFMIEFYATQTTLYKETKIRPSD